VGNSRVSGIMPTALSVAVRINVRLISRKNLYESDATPAASHSPRMISAAQRKRLFAIAKKAGWSTRGKLPQFADNLFSDHPITN